MASRSFTMRVRRVRSFLFVNYAISPSITRTPGRNRIRFTKDIFLIVNRVLMRLFMHFAIGDRYAMINLSGVNNLSRFIFKGSFTSTARMRLASGPPDRNVAIGCKTFFNRYRTFRYISYYVPRIRHFTSTLFMEILFCGLFFSKRTSSRRIRWLNVISIFRVGPSRFDPVFFNASRSIFRRLNVSQASIFMIWDL